MTIPGQVVMPVIRAALARGQCVRMTVNGTSMWPIIHDGDVVELAPQCAAPGRGDIVLAEAAPARYVVHRVVRVHGACVWLRGDAQTHREGPLALHDLFGTVRCATHAGRNRTLDRGIWRLAGMVCMCGVPLVAWLRGLTSWLRNVSSRMLGRLQRSAFVRALLQRCRPNFIIQEATPDDLVRIATWLDLPAARDLPAAPTAPPGLTNYVATRGTQLLGFVRLMRHPAGATPRAGHWLYSLTVRTRYRGMGIGETLVRHVIDQATAEGAHELLLTVFEDNRPASALYEKLGFERVTVAALDAELAADVARYGRRRISLRKRLS
ncbi:MAG: GNAT family N-acetyltransferase [bacterium]|nr:GNAT family N-acetyltransferase [bacterium]